MRCLPLSGTHRLLFSWWKDEHLHCFTGSCTPAYDSLPDPLYRQIEARITRSAEFVGAVIVPFILDDLKQFFVSWGSIRFPRDSWGPPAPTGEIEKADIRLCDSCDTSRAEYGTSRIDVNLLSHIFIPSFVTRNVTISVRGPKGSLETPERNTSSHPVRDLCLQDDPPWRSCSDPPHPNLVHLNHGAQLNSILALMHADASAWNHDDSTRVDAPMLILV